MRVYVAGQSGAGKTTVAEKMAGIYGMCHYESDMVRHPGRPEYVEGAEANRETFSQEIRRYSERPAWVIDGVLKDRALRSDVMDRADEIVYLAPPRITSELHVFKRRLRRRKPITFQFVRRRAKKARRHLARKKRWEADLEPHGAKTVILRSQREIDRYLNRLRAGGGEAHR